MFRWTDKSPILYRPIGHKIRKDFIHSILFLTALWVFVWTNELKFVCFLYVLLKSLPTFLKSYKGDN